jgi:hypothetical protein
MNIELSAGAPSPGASRPPLPLRERNEVRVAARRSFGETMTAAFLECKAITSFSKRNNHSLDDRAVRNQEGITGKRAGALDLLTNKLLQLRIEKRIATLAAQDVIAVFRDEEDRVVLALRADTERSFHHGSGIALRSHWFRRTVPVFRRRKTSRNYRLWSSR